jgi:hypothetical protein
MANQSVLVFSRLQRMIFMKECGNRIKQQVFVFFASQTVLKNKVERALKYGQMGATTLETSLTVLNKVLGFIFGQMVPDIKVIGSLTKCQAKVHSSGRMVEILKGNLKTGLCTALVSTPGKMVVVMRAITVSTRSMVKALTHILMEVSTVENGLMASSME